MRAAVPTHSTVVRSRFAATAFAVVMTLAPVLSTLAADAPEMVPAPAAAVTTGAVAAPGGAAGSRPEVVLVRVRSIIHPVAAEVVLQAIAEADEAGAAAVIVELDTPGGLLTSTREIFTGMLGARTPVVIFVGPAGAQAASAGFFLLMAGDVAAMAPGTNTGAAHPVGGNGETIEGVMGEKVEQDAAATIRALAARHGRNATLAEEAVLKSRSFTSQEALDDKLVEVLAEDVEHLLVALDGRPLAKLGANGVLHTRDATVREIEMSTFQRVRSTIVHPNVAYLLMTLGGLGLYFELSTPGAVLPGVVGAICLVLAFYALSVLPVSYAGIALILLAVLFFIAEIKVVSHGLLTVGGLVALTLGSLMLFRTADPALRVSVSVIATMVLAAAAVTVFLTTLAIRARNHQVQTGIEGMVGERGSARSALAPRGKVFVHGELWEAFADAEVAAGDPVEVISAQGLVLQVRPVRAHAAARPEGVETVR